MKITFSLINDITIRRFTLDGVTQPVEGLHVAIYPDSAEVQFVDGQFLELRLFGQRAKSNKTLGHGRHHIRYSSVDDVPEWAKPLTSLETQWEPSL
jgi:hypothetical protein